MGSFLSSKIVPDTQAALAAHMAGAKKKLKEKLVEAEQMDEKGEEEEEGHVREQGREEAHAWC